MVPCVSEISLVCDKEWKNCSRITFVDTGMSWDVMLFPSEASLNILFNGLPIYLHPFTSTAKKKKPYLKDWRPRGTVFVYSVVKFKKKGIEVWKFPLCHLRSKCLCSFISFYSCFLFSWNIWASTECLLLCCSFLFRTSALSSPLNLLQSHSAPWHFCTQAHYCGN